MSARRCPPGRREYEGPAGSRLRRPSYTLSRRTRRTLAVPRTPRLPQTRCRAPAQQPPRFTRRQNWQCLMHLNDTHLSLSACSTTCTYPLTLSSSFRLRWRVSRSSSRVGAPSGPSSDETSSPERNASSSARECRSKESSCAVFKCVAAFSRVSTIAASTED